MEGVRKNIFMKDLMENIFTEGATERAIARTTATNIVAKPSSGETTRS